MFLTSSEVKNGPLGLSQQLEKGSNALFLKSVYRNMTISRKVQTSNLKFVSSSLRKTNFIAKSLFIEDMG